MPGYGPWYREREKSVGKRRYYNPDDELDPTGTGETPEEAAGRMSTLFKDSQTPVS